MPQAFVITRNIEFQGDRSTEKHLVGESISLRRFQKCDRSSPQIPDAIVTMKRQSFI